ncbi:hypothetical protein [Nonomuraea sp. 10N515B]|uniref:hypothetical protein n=1 Tax=Nonomuraea sp. 10N515B TaxID=3457422 RepID=UPI003FCD5145
MVLPIPQFLVPDTGSVFVIYLAMLAMRFAMSALYGPVAALLGVLSLIGIFCTAQLNRHALLIKN